MNPRKIFKQCMAWCPGVEAAARFIPDIEVPRSVTAVSIVITLGLVILTGFMIQSLTPREAAPLKVIVNGEVFYDDTFTEDFNYSRLIRREGGLHIYFFEAVDHDEFADEVEIKRFEVESLRDVWPILDRIKMPNIVRGFARLICNGTYEELSRLFFEEWEGIGISLGDYSDPLRGKGGVIYSIRRTPTTGEEVERIRISKGYKINEMTGATIWRLEVKVYSFPPLEVVFIRFPKYAPR